MGAAGRPLGAVALLASPESAVVAPPLLPRRAADRRRLCRLLLSPRLLPQQRLSARRGMLVVRAAQVSSNDFKTGMTIEFDGAPYKVVGAWCGAAAAAKCCCELRRSWLAGCR